MAGFKVLNRETSSFSMNHLSSLLSANPASPSISPQIPAVLSISSSSLLHELSWISLSLFNMSFFFLISQASAQVSIIVKTFSPPPERDSTLTLVTPHYGVHLSDLSTCVYSIILCVQYDVSKMRQKIGDIEQIQSLPCSYGVST